MKSAVDPRAKTQQAIRAIGIDPGGANGAVAVLSYTQPIDRRIQLLRRFYNPTLKNGYIDIRQLYNMLKPWLPARVFVEALTGGYSKKDKFGRSVSSAHQSPVASFKLGANTHRVLALLELIGQPYDEIYPMSWKSKAGLINQPKKNSVLLAQTLWPDCGLTLTKDHNLADAALIARHGILFVP